MAKKISSKAKDPAAPTATQGERDAKAHELIDTLYTTKLKGEERQIEGRKVRARLRNIDRAWRESYAKYIENYSSDCAPLDAPGQVFVFVHACVSMHAKRRDETCGK